MAEIREPQKVNSIEKKNKIIEAGLSVFGEKGYYNTTTVEIARLAGVSTGIVYSYFKDKKDILIQALHLYFGRIFRPLQEALEQAKAPVDLESTIRHLIRTAVKSHSDNLTAHEEMIAMNHLDEDVHALFMESERTITETIVRYLRVNGINLPHLTEKAHIAYSLVESLCHEYVYHRHDYIDYDAMIEDSVRILVCLFTR